MKESELLLQNAGKNVLLMADTDATQSFVFESSRLPEIRGASRRLHDLNKSLNGIVKDYGGAPIYAGGGALLAHVPAEKAQALIEAIETRYPAETGAATITAVSRPLPPDIKQNEFGHGAAWLAHILRRRKESKDASPFWETLPHQVRCVSCQKRPALAGLADAWCQICWNKREYKGRYLWFKEFEDYIPRGHAYFDGRKERAEHPQDMDELGQVCRSRRGYVGFIYLDGDNIGRWLQHIPTDTLYREFSETMEAETRSAVFNALAARLRFTQVTGSQARIEVGQPKLAGQQIWIHPFEIITIGGDDVMLIVPAHSAIPIAVEIGRAFEQVMTRFAQDKLGQKTAKITMSGGVVIADDRTHVRLMRELAGQLLYEAKKLPEGGLDFLVLKSADMLDDEVKDVRERYPYLIEHGDRRTGKDIRLVARPYTYEEAEIIWNNLEQLKEKGFATSQIHLLAKSLLDGRSPATLFYEYQRNRKSRDHQSYERLQNLLTQLYGDNDRNPLPWQSVSGEDYSHRTALWDIAELYDFVP